MINGTPAQIETGLRVLQVGRETQCGALVFEPVPMRKEGNPLLPIHPFVHSAHLSRLLAGARARVARHGWEISFERQFQVAGIKQDWSDARIEWRTVWVPVHVDDAVPDEHVWDVIGDWLKLNPRVGL